MCYKHQLLVMRCFLAEPCAMVKKNNKLWNKTRKSAFSYVIPEKSGGWINERYRELDESVLGLYLLAE